MSEVDEKQEIKLQWPNQKLVGAFFKSNSADFWKLVRRIKRTGKNCSNSPVVNGLNEPEAISDLLSSKFSKNVEYPH